MPPFARRSDGLLLQAMPDLIPVYHIFLRETLNGNVFTQAKLLTIIFT
jgi:hypothetical protein